MKGALVQRLAPLVLVAALLAACGGGGEGAREVTFDGETVPVDQLTGALDGLCQARGEAERDLTRARATFYDRSHDVLHTIARILEPRDISQAARLLEAKQLVEADVSASPPRPSLEADLDRLAEVTKVSLDELGIEASSCPA